MCCKRTTAHTHLLDAAFRSSASSSPESGSDSSAAALSPPPSISTSSFSITAAVAFALPFAFALDDDSTLIFFCFSSRGGGGGGGDEDAARLDGASVCSARSHSTLKTKKRTEQRTTHANSAQDHRPRRHPRSPSCVFSALDCAARGTTALSLSVA